MTTLWQHRYALRMSSMDASAIRELLKLTQNPDIISFAGGLPAPELFPLAEFEAATQRVLAKQGAQALQYGPTEGYNPLRDMIVDKMATYGIEARRENILITSGSQQALDLIGKLLLNPGDMVLTERPTYLGALQAWRAYQADFLTVPLDEDGMCTDTLGEALRSGPKFMYVLPNFHNPAGVTLSRPRRQMLLTMADAYGIPIVEDDPYGELRYEGEHIPPLLVTDAKRHNHDEFLLGNVIYLSTFSKTLAPGLRLGWMVAPTSVIESCVKAKQGMDLHTSSFVQMVTYEVAKDGFLRDHTRKLRAVYRERRDVMLAAMARYFPDEVTWTRPEGGLFLWATLPDGCEATAVLQTAIQHQVAFVPGNPFYPHPHKNNTMRLNFSNAQPAQIEAGIRRLGKVLKMEIGNSVNKWLFFNETSAETAVAT